MTDIKRKNREDGHSNIKNNKGRNNFKKRKQNEGGKDGRRKRVGPRLPNALLKELQLKKRYTESDDEEIGSDDDGVMNDLYEYEEGVAEEESKKNKRFDPVENYEYELPDEFEDENVSSDEGDGDGDGDEGDRRGDDNDEEEEEDDGKHSRLLQEITGLPTDAFDGKKKKRDVITSEAYPESEYNPSRDILDGDGRISIHDLMDPIHGKPGFSRLRKNMSRMEKKSKPIHAPLPKPDQDRVEREAAYDSTKKGITEWEPLIKRNREAPTIYFDEDKDLGFSTIGAIAAQFEPRSDFEKQIASLVGNDEVVEAHRKDGARLLELNKVSVEDVKDRQDQLAKMRSLLFRHEMKAKRVKKIKSKVYHRLLKKDRLKLATVETDPEAAKEQAEKQEYKRAKERMDLKHKNKSKWARRILERGLDLQDEGTRAAIAAQLAQHALLTRKANNMKESSSGSSSSSEESNDDEDDFHETHDGSDHDAAKKLLNKAKDKTLQVLEGDEESPSSGVLSLPFMVRGLKRRKESADEEAKLALEEFESSLRELDDKNEQESQETNVLTGKRVFGAQKNQVPLEPKKKATTDNYYGDSDSEDEIDASCAREENNIQREVHFDPDTLRDESEMGHDSLFKSFEDIAKDPTSKTSYEVAIFAGDSWKKMNGSSVNGKRTKAAKEKGSLSSQNTKPVGEEDDGDSDTDSEGQMVDGILSSGPKPAYEIPSQEELIRRAFAGDDVEDSFEREKEEALNEENPEPEKPVLLPGWGQWTNIQKKRGPPSWMLQEHDIAKKKREEALKKRKDANLNHVIISEKRDKKAEKLHTQTLPYPFTSQDVFEQSIRMPIGPEFNPVTAVGGLTRPEVVKRSGVIIKPIKFEEVDPHERAGDHKRGSVQKKKGGKNKSKSTKKRSV